MERPRTTEQPINPAKEFADFARKNGMGAEAIFAFHRINEFYKSRPDVFQAVFGAKEKAV